ncbi:unnamed protein product [Rotaria sordida]|uniref:DYW domain-containing protein n=1 Tax=Rotaria sordida TaxID=392033 RepID=A0A815K9M6_9BILA|nr:unnamed protein product [Rotaria sordida]
MFNTLLYYRSTSRLIIMKRFVALKSNGDVGAQIKSFNEKKQFKKTLELFDKYKENDVKNLSSFIITQALKACTQMGDLQRGLIIHCLISSRIKTDCYISGSLIHLYMQCSDVVRAQSVFDMSKNKTIIMYGAMMKGYIKNNKAEKALQLFNKIHAPDEVIILLLFNACAQLETLDALNLTKKVSKEIPKSFFSNPRLLTSLLDALMKCGDVNSAESLFNNSKEKSLSIYGAMMKGYIKNNMPDKAIDLFNKIQAPDEIIVTLLFNACAQLENRDALNLTKKVSKEIPKSFFSNPYLSTSLLDALMKCGDVNSAESLFNNSKEKSLSIYGAMMKGYMKNNMPDKVIDLFNKIQAPDEIIMMLLFNACAQLDTPAALNLAKKVSKEIPKSFLSNSNLSTSLLDALMKCGDVEYAQTLFRASTIKVLSMYGAMMSGYNKENNLSKVLDLFNRMKLDRIEPDIIIYLYLIKALSHYGDDSLVEAIVKQIPNSFLVDNRLQTALIDMREKIGCVDEAEQIFEKIRQPDEIGYSTMINAYGLNGMGTKALELYHRMPREFIDEVTDICVLNACSHSGLVNEARLIFKNIQMKTERIYEAEELINEYERDHSPVSTMYMALLSGARNINNSCLSQKVYDRMKKLFSDMKNPLISAAILLANVYGSSGEIDKASDIRIELNKSGAKKRPGISSTIVDGWSFDFRAHDRSHPRTADIYAEVEKMSKELIAHGHKYDASWITRPLDPDETVESVLCGHSEKLAIAWHFIDNRKPSRIFVRKNLRVCGDCHRATKIIAAIRQCTIIVRDANRIHHFHTNGQCSCNDYF